MKHFFYKKKSRWLLLAILAMMVGASPTWAETISENFESVTVDANDNTKLSNGWFIKGGTNIVTKNVTNSSYWSNSMPDGFDYVILGTGGSYNIGANNTNTAFGQYNNSCTSYLIIPIELTGKIKFYAGGIRTSSTTVKLYRVTYNSSTGEYSIGTQIGSTIYPSARSSSTTRPNWLAAKQQVDLGSEHTMVAFLLNGTAIDEFEAEEYVFTPYVEPATIAATVKGNTAEVSWTAGDTDETLTGWNLEYKKSSEETWTEVHGLGASTLSYSLKNLEVDHSYNVRVNAVYGENESIWKETSFNLTYSTPAPTSVDGDGITNVTYGSGAETVNYDTSKTPYYQNNSAQVGAVTAGSEATVAITFSTGYTYGTVVWVDWNQNYEFEDSEIVFAGESTSAKPNTLNATFTVPAEQAAGNYRMRICAADSYYDSHKTMGTAAGANPTPTSSYCVAQDYTLKVKEAAAYAMSVSDTDIVFGTVKNTTTTKTFTIINDGDNALTNVSVVSSDNEIFTVSETGFDIPAEGSKVITVTFVKGVAGNYSETITVSQANVDNKEINVTATYEAPSPATMAITIAEAAVGETVAFGSVGKQAQKTLTVTNGGDQTLHITSIVSNNTTDFTVAPATLEVAGHSSETFTVTFVYPNENPVLDTEKTATITVTASNEGIDPVVFAVTGTRIDQWSEDFSGNALSEGWTNPISGYTAWTFSDGVAYGNYANYKDAFMQSPLLRVEEGQSLTFLAKGSISSSDLYVYAVKKNGTTAKTYDFSSVVSANYNSDFTEVTVDGLDEGSYYLQFKSYKSYIKQIEGFKLDMNDPKMGIYTDAECTVAATTAETKDFGFATTDQTATYYIKNDGTGTMTLSKGDNPAGFTATLDKTSVAAGEYATLTITMPAADNAGYHSGNIVVTATDLGTFTVAASGVVVDENKLYLDFSSANIPSTWTATNWTKNSTDISTGYNGGTLQTATLTATANEQVVVRAKQEYTSSSYTFGVNYRKVGDEEWSELIAPANIGTNYVTLAGTITEAGNYELQFTGKYVHISNIYGLAEAQEPVMAVYDGESLAGASYNYGNVSNENDATWTLTVKNEGKAKLTGLAAALSGTNAAHYSVEISGATGEGNDEIEANAQATITVKQLKDNLGSHEATLTISADAPIADKVIALSGYTYNHNKMFVDFESGSFPTGWTTNSWTVATTSGNKHARAGFTASSLITTPLNVAEDESLIFKAKRQYSNSAPTFQIRYTTDGGVTWSDYADYASQVTSADFTNITLSGINAGTAIVEIYGRYVDIDDIIGFAPTTAPILSLTESAVAVASGSTKEFGNLTEAGTATYTLSNTGTANLVSTVATTGVATAAISGEGEGVTISENTVTLAPGKSATITLTLPYEAPYGEKAGAMTISSEGWVGDMVVNYTATTVDPTALYVDFNNNTKPEGWYQEASGWIISTGRAHVYTGLEKSLVTEQYAAEEGKNVLRFDAKLQSNYAAGELKIYTSTDRKTWTLAKTVTLTSEDQQVALDALANGSYYVKFESTNASIDNLTGLKTIQPAPEHDLYVSSATFPTTTLVPETVAGVNATATVYSLRANETGVYAKLFFDETEVATAEAQNISKDGSVDFTLTGNVPATEKTYAAKIVMYYSDNSVAFETLTTNVEVAHTRTLNIASFTRTDGDGALDADGNNQISPSFSVTVENTGSTAATPTVKIYQGGNVVATATAAAAIAAGATSDAIALTATNMSAGEGGELAFTAKAFWTAEDPEAKATSASNVVITVNAAAPKFALYQGEKDVNDGDNVEFGLTKTWKTLTFNVANEGNKVMEVLPATPAGFDLWEKTSAQATETDSEWSLYFYKESVIDGDQGTFKTTNDENIFILNNLALAQSEGVGFSVHNSDWSTQYGWKSAGVNATATAVELAEATSATGWLQLPDGNYDVIWNTEDHTITFKKAGAFLVAAGESADIDVTLRAKQGKVSGNLTFTYAVDATTNKTFTLALSGRSVAENTWTEAFNDYSAAIPATWTNNGWSVAGEYNDYPGAAYTNTATATLITPRLAATEGEELTFDVVNNYYNTATYAYSTDKVNWSAETTISGTGEKSFVAPADGNYYIRFTGRGTYLQNFVGFKLNIPEHDTEIAAYSVPETGKQLNVYTATVTLKENAGKAEEVTAKLIVDSEEKATKAETLTANGQTVITLTWTPGAVISEAVKAYVRVTGTGIDLQTDEIDLTIAEVYTLDENSSATTVETVSDETIVLKRKFVEGWNTVCLPFDITDVEIFFGAGAVAYNYTDYTDGALNFTKVTELEASYPYIVYVKTAITTDMTLNNITIESNNNQGWYRTYNNAKFQGTYAPIAAPGMEGLWGVTTEAKIAKGTDKASMKGFRAYFELPNGVSSARLAFTDEDGTTTVIKAIELDKQNGEVYNLNGQRVENMKKGNLYIINGKKQIRR